MLADVATVQIIVILDAALVFVVDLHDECEELVIIYNLEQIVLLQERCGHEGHLHVTSNRPRELEDVEFKRINFLVEIGVALDQFFNVLSAQVKIDAIAVHLDRAEITSCIVFSTFGRLDGY